jgi:DNA-binding NtrC family response regulator
MDGHHEQDGLLLALQSWASPSAGEPLGDPIRAAQRGTLFIDSVTSLSRDTQRLMLAFLKNSMNVACADGGDPWVGRFAVGNAEHLSVAVSEGRFLPDLYDSLDKVRVELDRVVQRVA